MSVPGAVSDPAGIYSERPSLATGDHRFLAYAAWTRHPGRLPGLLVIVEAFGVNDHIEDVCRRFAAQGYLTIAPELFARVGGPPTDVSSVMAKMGGMRDADSVGDMRTAVNWLRANDRCNGRVASIGFCMGGRLSLLLATQRGVLDRAIDCWGGRITRRTAPPDENRPEVVVERIAELDCPLLGVFGEEDQNPNADDIAELRAALDAHGKPHRILVYPGAGHAFFADYRESYRDGPAHAAWEEFLGFLAPLKGD